MGRQDFVDIPDSSKVVALDFGSAEFRRNAHRLVAVAAIIASGLLNRIWDAL